MLLRISVLLCITVKRCEMPEISLQRRRDDDIDSISKSTPSDDSYNDPEFITPFRTKRTISGWQVYQGPPALIIAIDFGTTFSGASFCILSNGSKPSINDVISFPGQQTSSSKIPTLVLYSQDGLPRLCGAEATNNATADRIIDEGGSLARWWKMELRPDHLKAKLSKTDEDAYSSQLPFRHSAETITTHFFSYMASCIGRYIQSKFAQGDNLLSQLASSVRYILTIPNGWELQQQEMLRRCCLNAGLVTDPQTISFVTEAESSINFCTLTTKSSEWFAQEGGSIVVADCGGGTVDVSAYKIKKVQPSILLSETSASDCFIAGSTTIDSRAKTFLRNRLSGTSWDSEEELQSLQDKFSTSLKEIFAEPNQDYFLPIGRASDNDESLGIKKGKLIMRGVDIAALFEPSISIIVKSIQEKMSLSQDTACAMVGGFSESVYLRRELQKRLGKSAMIFKPDEATSKAVAKGAIAWYLDGIVRSRVAKLHYGIRCTSIFRYTKPSHIVRAKKVIVGHDGIERLSGFFGKILEKGDVEDEDQEHLKKFGLTWPEGEALVKDIGLVIYRGPLDEPPEFMDEEGFETLCKFRIDMEPFRGLLPRKPTKNGKAYVAASIKLAIRLSGTEINAQTIFESKGQVFRGPVMTYSE